MSLTVSLVSKRYMRGAAEMKFSSLFVRISTFTKYIYILHDGSLVIYFLKRSQIDSRLSRFNFTSGAPVCLVRFGEEKGEIIDVYVKFTQDK